MHSPAEDAAIPAEADAALFHLTHDIMRTPSAVARVVHHLKPEGRVVAMGIKWAPWWCFRINFRVWRLAQAYTTTSFEGLRAPPVELPGELIPAG